MIHRTLSGRLRRLALALATVAAVALPLGAAPALAHVDWQPGPGAAGDNSFIGFINSPTGPVPTNQPFDVTGWIVDMQAQGWAGVTGIELYNGLKDQGGTLLATGPFAQPRADVGALTSNPYWTNSGFRVTVPAGTLQPGAYTLTVYAITPGKGQWFKQVSVNVGQPAAAPVAAATTTVTVTTSTPATTTVTYADDPYLRVLAPAEGGSVSTADDTYDVRGFALDRNATSGTGVDRVQVYIGGDRGSGRFIGDAQLGKSHGNGADFGSQFANAGFEISFKPTEFSTGSTRLVVYARSSVTGKETQVSYEFNIVD